MQLYTRSQVIVPSDLHEATRRSFGRALFRAHRQIFECDDFEEFYRYVLKTRGQRTRIEVYYNQDDEVVGYCSMHLFDRDLGGRATRVHRIETGLLPAYRGRALCANFLAREFASSFLSAPRKEHYFFGCLVHPSSYCGLSRHVDRIWPHPERATPPELVAFIHSLADDFGLPSVTGLDPLVRKVGWITREPPSAQERWRRSTDPRVKLYLRNNPDYRSGLGMSTLIPITPWGIVSGFSRNTLYKLRRRLHRLWCQISPDSSQRSQLRELKTARPQAPRHQGGSVRCPGAAR